MKLEIPATLKDYSIDQANRVLEYLRQDPFEKLSDERAIVGLVAAVTGISEDQLMRVDMEPLKKAYKLIIGHLKRKAQTPPKVVNINGQEYVFNQDLNGKGWTAGRYVDIKTFQVEIETMPEYIVAICYIEKDSVYGDHPIETRAKIMKENFSGEYYIDLIAFFLRKYTRLKPGFSLLQIAKSQIQTTQALQQIHGSNGSTSSREKNTQSGSRSHHGNGRNFFSRLLTKLRKTRRS